MDIKNIKIQAQYSVLLADAQQKSETDVADMIRFCRFNIKLA